MTKEQTRVHTTISKEKPSIGDIANAFTAFPKAAVQADRNQRKPLTHDQIWDNDDIMAANAEADLLMSELVTLVRAVEKAHGIT